jgi:hypothetical protein
MTDSLRMPIEGMAIVARLAGRGRLRPETIGEAVGADRAGLGAGLAVAVLDGVDVRDAAGAVAKSAQPTTETLNTIARLAAVRVLVSMPHDSRHVAALISETDLR